MDRVAPAVALASWLAVCAPLAFGSACSPATELAGSSVVLIVVDALRADNLGRYGYDRDTSPFFDAWAADGVVFESAIATSSHTVPSVLSLLTSAWPHRHANQFFPRTQSFRKKQRRVRPEFPAHVQSFAERMANHGYRTGAVVTNPWLSARYGFDRGFDHYTLLAGRGSRPPGHEVNAEVRSLLDGWRGERFFLYVHYMDVHAPYEPSETHRRAFAPQTGTYVYRNGPVPELAAEDLAYTRALYDAGVRDLDRHLGDLVAALRERGLEHSTLVVFTADHGDELHEHGGMGHGLTLYEEVLRVPLVFRHPALAARRLRTPVSGVDILPTVLDLVGAGSGEGMDGISLAPWILGGGEPPSDRVLLSELGELKAARRGDTKWIRSREAEAWDRGFELARDAGEARPLDPSPDWAPELADALAALPFGDASSAAHPAERSDEEAVMERQLQALGYLE